MHPAICRCTDCLWEEIRNGPQREEMIRPRRRLPLDMSLAEAVRIAGTLGRPGKMPGYSYGLDAWECKRGQELMTVAGSACSNCYAMSGWYTLRGAASGMVRRQKSLDHPRWVDAIVRQILHYCKAPPDNYFRWHDSGDLQGAWHLANIVTVCRRTPKVKHWLPTREYGMVEEWVVAGGEVPSNLMLRLSADMYDELPVLPPILKHFYTSTIHRYSGMPVEIDSSDPSLTVECQAHTRGNRCGPCRACWNDEVQNISYVEH